MKTTRDEIECAIAVGLSFILPLFLIFTNPIFDLDAELSPFTLEDAGLLLMFFASYAVAPVLYQQIKGDRFSRLLPIWVFFAQNLERD